LRMSAGASLTVIRLPGNTIPEFLIAARTRSLEWLTQIDVCPALRPRVHPAPLSHRQHHTRQEVQGDQG
jgi:hypothetical protein